MKIVENQLSAEDDIYVSRDTVGSFTMEEMGKMSYSEFKEVAAQKIAKELGYVYVPKETSELFRARQIIEEYLNTAIGSGVSVDKAMEYLQRAMDNVKEKMQYKEAAR